MVAATRGQTAPHVTGRAWRCELSQVGRQVVLLLGEAVSVAGYQTRGSLREDQLVCALLDGIEDQAGLASQLWMEQGVRSKLHFGLRWMPLG